MMGLGVRSPAVSKAVSGIEKNMRNITKARRLQAEKDPAVIRDTKNWNTLDRLLFSSDDGGDVIL
jgi:hypothetical protein